MAASKDDKTQDEKNNRPQDFGFTSEQLERFLDLLDAVRKADSNGGDGGPPPPRTGRGPTANDLEREERAFSYEILSALLGRNISSRAATVKRSKDQLHIKEPKLGAGSTAEVVAATGAHENLPIDAEGVVKLKAIKDKDRILQIVIKESSGLGTAFFVGEPPALKRSGR